MKKMLFVLMALAIAMPAMAATTLTEGTKTATSVVIGYNRSGDELPRAFALTIAAVGGTITGVTPAFVGQCTASAKGYGIFPGSIVIGTDGSVSNDGTPVEPDNLHGSGQSALNTNQVIVALGSLYDAAQTTWKPADIGNLFTVTVSAGTTSITLTPETAFRGGVVGENAQTITVQPLTVTFASQGTITGTPVVAQTTAAPAISGRVNAVRSESFTASGVTASTGTLEYQFTWGDGQVSTWGAATQTHTFATATTATWSANVTVQARLQATPTVLSTVSAPLAVTGESLKSTIGQAYTNWVAAGRPACWGYQFQPLGDINGKDQGTGLGQTRIGSVDLGLFSPAYGKKRAAAQTAGQICADIDHLDQGTGLGASAIGSVDLGILSTNYGKKTSGLSSTSYDANYNFHTVAP